MIVKRPPEQRKKLPPELEAFANGQDAKLRLRRPRSDKGQIRDPREGYMIAGVANRDARQVYDVRVSAMRGLWQQGQGDPVALEQLGQHLRDVLRLRLWRARRLTEFEAFVEDVLEVPAARARELAEAAAHQQGEALQALSDRVVALWLRTEAGLYEGSEQVRVCIRGAGPEAVLELSVPVEQASRALAGAGVRHAPLARAQRETGAAPSGAQGETAPAAQTEWDAAPDVAAAPSPAPGAPAGARLLTRRASVPVPSGSQEQRPSGSRWAGGREPSWQDAEGSPRRRRGADAPREGGWERSRDQGSSRPWSADSEAQHSRPRSERPSWGASPARAGQQGDAGARDRGAEGWGGRSGFGERKRFGERGERGPGAGWGSGGERGARTGWGGRGARAGSGSGGERGTRAGSGSGERGTRAGSGSGERGARAGSGSGERGTRAGGSGERGARASWGSDGERGRERGSIAQKRGRRDDAGAPTAGGVGKRAFPRSRADDREAGAGFGKPFSKKKGKKARGGGWGKGKKRRQGGGGSA